MKKEKIDSKAMIGLFFDIWRKRRHNCQNCGRYLGKEPSTVFFDHLLEKSTYPEISLEEDNIFLVCMECHDSKTRGFPGEKHKQAIDEYKSKRDRG